MGLSRWRQKERGSDRQDFVESYAQNNGLRGLGTPRAKMILRFPRVFSFIDNPEQTITALNQLARYARDERVEEIQLHQRHCKTIDHCAETVASLLVLDARREHEKAFVGRPPRDPLLRRMVYAVGVASELFGLREPPEFIKFPVTHGRREQSDSTTTAETATRELVEYIDRCLATFGYGLTRTARIKYTNLVAEVITNAESHSGSLDWWVAAYYVRAEDGRRGECHIAIFNFGRSLADSLQSLDDGSLLKRMILDRVERHREGFSGRWQEDDLWTLFAIQRRVSRRNNEVDAVGNYGQGTADLIEAFHVLADDQSTTPKMCVVSGSTHILFDGSYRIGQNAEGRSRIAFNDTNSLADPPDSRYVRHLGTRFPGTLVSLRFSLGQEHLDELSG